MRIQMMLHLLLAVGACSGEDSGRVAPVGTACTSDTGCGDDLYCNTDVSNGYCTKTCPTPGDAAECPDGSICDTVGQSIICVQLCTSDNECRTGFACNGVSNSNVKACKPN